MENQRSVTLLFVLAGLSAGEFVYAASRDIVAFQNMEDPVLAGVVSVTTLLGLVAGVGTFFYVNRHVKANEYVQSAVAELKRITWPNREDTVNNTGIVIGAALGFGLLMFVYDFGWSTITTYTLYSGVGK